MVQNEMSPSNESIVYDFILNLLVFVTYRLLTPKKCNYYRFTVGFRDGEWGCVILGLSVTKDFTNIGQMSGGRLFSGFPSRNSPQRISLSPRNARSFDLRRGDLLRIDNSSSQVRLALQAFSKTGSRKDDTLGLGQSACLDPASYEFSAHHAFLRAHGADPAFHDRAVFLPQASEPFVIKAEEELTIWLINARSAADLVTGENPGSAYIWHQRCEGSVFLPEPLGQIRDEFTVKRGTAQAYELHQGESVQIIDIDGQQCSDFQALRMNGLDTGREIAIDSTATRSMVRRAYPAPGLFDKFFDPDMRPLLKVVQDTCGRHDTFGLACTARSYEERGFPGHLNCSDNISFALAPYGVTARPAWPAINFFWNTWLDAHHNILTEEAFSRPGDYVVMEALDNLVCVTTACPDDIDPINGWNPTDIHVRIYTDKTTIPKSVAYRVTEDAPMQKTQPSAFHARLEPLTNHFTPSRDIWSAASFPATGSIGEYWACRESATLQDMSGLRKIDIIGPDAERLLQLALTRDVAKLAVWRGTYALICNEMGEVIDDGTLFRLAPHLYRWCCGNEQSGRWLSALADQHDLQVRIHDLDSSLPNLALQGPRSRQILDEIVFTQPNVPSLQQMNWFGVTVARLHDREGPPFMLARTGYTGELGYELFCAERDALAIWDALMAAGENHNLVPMGSEALDMIRIEAGFASRAEFAAGADAFEAGLGFAVNLNKSAFIGQKALKRNAEAQRKQLKGLKFECSDTPQQGAPIFAGEQQVGMITSATWSPMFECAIAMARVAVEHAETGQQLEVGQLDGRMKRLLCTVTDIPFFDPKRERARA